VVNRSEASRPLCGVMVCCFLGVGLRGWLVRCAFDTTGESRQALRRPQLVTLHRLLCLRRFSQQPLEHFSG
jgi:hypothetical protein